MAWEKSLEAPAFRRGSNHVSRLDPLPALIFLSSNRKLAVSYPVSNPDMTKQLSAITIRYCHPPKVYREQNKRVLDVEWTAKGFPWLHFFNKDQFLTEWTVAAASLTSVEADGRHIPEFSYLTVQVKPEYAQKTNEVFLNAFREMNVRLVLFTEKIEIKDVTCFNISYDGIEKFDLENHRLVASSQEEIDRALSQPLPPEDGKGS
jgi:hypothetical protein